MEDSEQGERMAAGGCCKTPRIILQNKSKPVTDTGQSVSHQERGEHNRLINQVDKGEKCHREAIGSWRSVMKYNL